MQTSKNLLRQNVAYSYQKSRLRNAKQFRFSASMFRPLSLNTDTMDKIVESVFYFDIYCVGLDLPPPPPKKRGVKK